MNEHDSGGPAFPSPGFTNQFSQYVPSTDGMTLRDYFAAKACEGICVSRDEAGVLLKHGYEWIAKESYAIADAMLTERNK